MPMMGSAGAARVGLVSTAHRVSPHHHHPPQTVNRQTVSPTGYPAELQEERKGLLLSLRIKFVFAISQRNKQNLIVTSSFCSSYIPVIYPLIVQLINTRPVI